MPRLMWTKQKILQAVEKFKDENGRFPTSKELDYSKNLPSRSIFPKHFGKTYSEWRKEYGDNYSFIDQIFKRMDENELKTWLKKRLTEMETTYINEYEHLRKQHEPSASFWQSRFNWKNLMVELGLRDTTCYSKEKTIADFKNFIQRTNHIPSVSRLKEYDKKLLYSILHHFDRYNAFLDYMNCEYVRDYSFVEKTDDELIDDYIELCNHLGKLATLKEINKCKWTVSAETYLMRFGSIYKVRELAGLDKGIKKKRYYSRKLLENRIKRIIKEHGDDIPVKDFYIQVGCAKSTLAKFFGTTSVKKLLNL